ncbi:ATP-binding protein [Haloferax volcanii]|uniref:ATP-binding protein n=1 Tax=Haloferax volcanii TaxID=2246 RepID=UPI003D303254
MSSQTNLPTETDTSGNEGTLTEDTELELEFPWRRPPDRGLDDIGGLSDITEKLRQVVVRPLGPNRTEYDRFGIDVPNLLFEGPPGTGKTYTAEALAGELDYPFLVATPARVQSRFVNESGDQIQRLFREAARLGDQFGLSVVFFDEVDALLPARGRENQHQEDSKIVAEFLSYLERSSENNTLVIAATNRRDELDPAAVRSGRIDRELHFGYPDRETRYSVLKQHLQARPTNLSRTDIQQVAAETEGWSSAKVTSLVDDAARLAVERSSSAVEYRDLITAFEAMEQGTDPG